MNVEELLALNTWIDQEVRGRRVIEIYQNLHDVLNQNAQPNQPKQPFEQQKAALVQVLAEVDLARLTIDQLNFLEKLGIAPHLGETGISTVEDILVKNPVDIATAVARFGDIINQLNQGVSKSDQIKAGLCASPQQWSQDSRVNRAVNAKIEILRVRIGFVGQIQTAFGTKESCVRQLPD